MCSIDFGEVIKGGCLLFALGGFMFLLTLAYVSYKSKGEHKRKVGNSKVGWEAIAIIVGVGIMVISISVVTLSFAIQTTLMQYCL